MSDSPDRPRPPRALPPRPSLEQLRKQAKDLLRELRAESPNAALADAQLRLAREFGFESWPKLVHHVQALVTDDDLAAPRMAPEDLDDFVALAERVAAAYRTASVEEIRNINWENGTSFYWFRECERMHQALETWNTSAVKTNALALEDAKVLVARQLGYETWTELVQSLVPTPRGAKSDRTISAQYHVDRDENMLVVHGPLSNRHWDHVLAKVADEKISGLRAGGLTDDQLPRILELDHVTRLDLGLSRVTDDGLAFLAKHPRIEGLTIGGPRCLVTDRGLEVLRQLPALRRFEAGWAPKITDAGAALVASCTRIEHVGLMGTRTGDATIRALAGKTRLHHLKTGMLVSDVGIAALRDIPTFKTWREGDTSLSLMTFTPEHATLLLDGSVTDRGIANMAGLDGLFGLNLFWNTTALTPKAIASLATLPKLAFVFANGALFDDAGMERLARFQNLRMIHCADAVATDAGYAAVGGSQTLELLAGGSARAPNARGLEGLAAAPQIRALTLPFARMTDHELSLLARFPSLTTLNVGPLREDAFRYVSACSKLEALRCGGGADAGDGVIEQIASCRLKAFQAGGMRITDRGLEVLAGMTTLESIELEHLPQVTAAGIQALAALPRLRALTLSRLPQVPRASLSAFSRQVDIVLWS